MKHFNDNLRDDINANRISLRGVGRALNIPATDRRAVDRKVAEAVVSGELDWAVAERWSRVMEYVEKIQHGSSETRKLRKFKKKSEAKGLNPHPTDPIATISKSKPNAILASHGYDVEVPEKTPEQAWNEHKSAFNQKHAKINKQHTIHRRDSSPFIVAHFTDVHLDDDATALSLLESDIKKTRAMGAITVSGGDILNNWPKGGRLASKYGEQSATIQDGLLRAKHFIDMLQPDIWVDGNHEEFDALLISLIGQWLPRHTLRDYWRLDFLISSPGGRPLRASVSHNYQKGRSAFHRLHGHIKEMLEGVDFDLYMDGHLHSAGVMQHYLPERGHTATLVASAGYKLADYYAARISRGGKEPKIAGRAHWILVDPEAPITGNLCTVYADPDQAADALRAARALWKHKRKLGAA